MDHQPIKILLAEDNEDDIFLMRKAFEEAKLLNLVKVVKDGEEAMAYLRRQGQYHDAELPGLLLLDIRMPKKDGFEVLKEIKSDPALKFLPVVIMTTSKQEEDVVKSYANGACSFITKPLGFTQFQEMIKQFELYWVLVSRVPEPIQ